GLREIRRIQLAKEEHARKTDDKKGSRRSSAEHGHGPSEEKKSLLFSAEVMDEEEVGEDRQPSSEASADADVSSPEPVVSPTSDAIPSGNAPSEKAKGKMKEQRRSSSIDNNGSLERLAASGVGRNGFVPTQEWVASWQQGLPLDIVMLTISEL
ncbi:hypothetical protein MPER_01895, partial [Moniliophthora perniciosa FA553]